MRKVLLGTPCYDGKVGVGYLHSLIGTIALAAQSDIAIHPVHINYDALVQRARNDLVKMALETSCDDLLFMDADQEWVPQDIVNLLSHSVDVVGAPVIKKSFTNPDYNVKMLPDGLPAPTNNLLQVEAIGTGCLRLSKAALQAVWDMSPEYINSGATNRMVFDVQIIDGSLISEDTVFCAKWRSAGGRVWIDPAINLGHTGAYTWQGNFANFISQPTS
jgi:hypothetical protein